MPEFVKLHVEYRFDFVIIISCTVQFWVQDQTTKQACLEQTLLKIKGTM